MSTANQRLTSGAVWMVLFKWSERLISVVSTLVLARLLVPADFGLVAMATAYIALLEVIGNLGVDSALIQRADASRAHYDTAWTFNLLIGAATALIGVASSPAMAAFYGDPRVMPVLCAMALASLLQSAENIGTVNFRKDLDFRREFKYQTSKKLVSLVAVVPLAFALRSYWALVIGTIIARLGGLLLSFWMSPYRPRLCLTAARELFVFSRWLLLGGVVVFARQRASDFVIGRYAGPQNLGLFSIANELGTMPATEIVMPVARAAFPVYSTIAGDLDALAETYLRVLGLVALLAIPAGIGLAATSGLLVPVLFGPKWTDAIPVMALLSLYGVTLAIQGNIFPVFLARGRPQFSVWVVTVQLFCLLPLLVILTRMHGSTGAGAAYLISGCLSTPVALAFAARELKIPTFRTIGVLWRPAAASCTMLLALDLLSPRVLDGAAWATMGLQLAAEVLLGATAYIAVSAALWLVSGRPAGAESSALQYISRQFASRFARGQA